MPLPRVSSLASFVKNDILIPILFHDFVGDAVPYQLSVAVPAGPSSRAPITNYISAIDKSVSFWNLMAYDYAGSWSPVTDYLANVYTGTGVSGITTDATMKWYVQEGATRSKVNIG